MTTKTSGPMRSVDTAGYMYYIGIHISRRRISASGEAHVRSTIGTLLPETSGDSATGVTKRAATVAGKRNIGRVRRRSESMNKRLSSPSSDASGAATCVRRLPASMLIHKFATESW